MCEVLRENFEEKWTEIEKNIKSASFIALDSEFSGLKTSNSLFDKPSERYASLRDNVMPYIILEMGITTFNFDRDKNTYNGHTYAIYLCPRTFSNSDDEFQCRASTFEFLCQYNFDFNKAFYHGIPYLNEDQFHHVLQELREGHLFRLVERSVSHTDERTIQALCSQVALWLAGGKQSEGASENSLLIQIPPNSQCRKYIAYIVHHELRRRFVSVWTVPEGGNIRVLKVTSSERAMLAQNETHESELQFEVLSAVRGAARVFQLLVDAGKPIVGHNLLLDLMMMYKQFYRPLPKSYSEFKANIHTLFPKVYDTKFMSAELKKSLPKAKWWESNGLDGLYAYFKGERGGQIAPCSPTIYSHNYVDGQNSDQFHDAGWDSYCTGFCFIRMAHYFASRARGSLSHAKPLTSTEYIALTATLCNKVNMIRGNVTHFVLDGDDPPSRRPDILLFQTKNKGKLDLLNLTEELAKFGNLDVKLLSYNEALVAAAIPGIVSDILREYYMHPDLTVSKYSGVRYNKMFQYGTIGCAAVAGFACAYIAYRAVSVGR